MEIENVLAHPKILKIKNKFEKELEEIKDRLADNLLYEIIDIKIEDIKPVSEKYILKLSDVTKAKTTEDVIKEKRNRYMDISEHIKGNFKKQLKERGKIPFKQTLKYDIGDKRDKRIQEKIDRWKQHHDNLMQDTTKAEEKWKEEVNQRIDSVDENLKKFYDLADYEIYLKWRVKPKEGNIVDLDPDEEKRKEKFLVMKRDTIILEKEKDILTFDSDLINLDSISLYSKKGGYIFDTLIPNIPMEINLEKEEVVESIRSNPEHVYDIYHEYVIWGTGWKWFGPFPYLADVRLEKLKYSIKIRYISDEEYADSTNPKTFQMVINTSHSWDQYEWYYLAYPICVFGSGGDFGQGGLVWDIMGNPFKINFSSTPTEDYFKGLEVDYYDGIYNHNIVSASFGYEGVGISIDSAVSNEAVCNVSASTGQDLQINISPYMNVLGIWTGVFHRFGWLKVLMNAIASERNKSAQVGKIKFSIPVHFYYIHHFGVGVELKSVAIYDYITDYSTEGKSSLLYYTRYQGIPPAKYSISISESEVPSGESTQINLVMTNLSKKVNFEDINIEIGNIEPYLRPVDGDFTKPNTAGEKIIEPLKQRKYSWILEGILTDESTITITPKFDITYRYGYPVLSTIGENHDTIDGPKITIAQKPMEYLIQ